jgi:hypothetical protein
LERCEDLWNLLGRRRRVGDRSLLGAGDLDLIVGVPREGSLGPCDCSCGVFLCLLSHREVGGGYGFSLWVNLAVWSIWGGLLGRLGLLSISFGFSSESLVISVFLVSVCALPWRLPCPFSFKDGQWVFD